MRCLLHIYCLVALIAFLSAGVYGADFQDQDPINRLREVTDELQVALENNADPDLEVQMVEEIDEIFAGNKISDTLLLSDAHFLAGVTMYNKGRYRLALERLSLSAKLRETIGVYDRRYASCLSNMAVCQFKVGDYLQALDIGKQSMKLRREAAGEDSSSLASNYLNMSSIYLELKDSRRAIAAAEAGLNISHLYPGKVIVSTTADLYQVISLSLLRNSEYTKALVYSREALRLYDLDRNPSESKQLMLNTTSLLYKYLNQPSEAENFILKGLDQINKNNLSDNYLLFINYAEFLAEYGRTEEGEKVLQKGLKMVSEVFGKESREYYLMLASQASFIHKATGKSDRALEIYRECFSYFESHPWDTSVKESILTDYAMTLVNEGENLEALEILDGILGATDGLIDPEGPTASEFNDSESSQNTLIALSLKYRALNILAGETGNNGYIIQAIETGKVLISLYGSLRLGMSEEESRNFLSAYAREYYTGIIENYCSLYKNNHDPELLKSAFEYSERSKVAGFLASIREVNATRFSIPDDLSLLDNEIQQRIGLYREFINNEKDRIQPDSQKIVTWEKITFDLLRSRDSLINIFEKRYPAYYQLKFKNEITPLDKVKRVIGKEANLLSYVLTQDKLFNFVVNKHHTEVITREVDSLFYRRLIRFKEILTTLPEKTSVRQPFNEYMDLAYELYKDLLEPAVPYLRGNKIVISPDNILSYLPFETFITSGFSSDELLYRDAPFALKKYRFSYIYSVTLSSETLKRSRRLSNDLVAFAPSYEGMEIEDTLLMLYPNLRGRISALPYAVGEAQDAVKQCGGVAFVKGSATEEAYKKNASGYDIIHLAMHTLIDDERPAYSKMVFTRAREGAEDGLLNTYEVYSIPLDAMMVVLSSCNTGSGILMTGEGILSLARGFLFAGSRSVVMSMWEVEDYSGSAVVKTFYNNIKKGQSKSAALRRARLNFLRDADQARSHPYYWATLVIYGDDSALYFNRIRLYSAFIVLLLAATILTLLVYREPRS
ncbi:MAG TPA: CHAT domain-containing tetratricopeptide repeat protein [Bacteroidales bacterium]|nr:CHAT domain-containing tetratricopeptide repeat protein [Bacteroidales bacterium]